MRRIHPENAGVSPSHLPVSCTPEGVSEVLMKVALILHWFSLKCLEFFSIWVFFHKHFQITGLQEKGEGISLTPLYHFHLLHRHLDISRAITVESSLLNIATGRTRTGNLWFPTHFSHFWFTHPNHLPKHPRNVFRLIKSGTLDGFFLRLLKKFISIDLPLSRFF